MMKISSSLEREYSGAAALNRSDAALSNDGDVVSMYIPRARFTFHKVNLTLQRLPAFVALHLTLLGCGIYNIAC